MATTKNNKTMINIKIDLALKQKAQKIADSFGLPLSTVVSRKLEEFVQNERLIFEKPLTPNKKTMRQIKNAVSDYKKKNNISGPFNGVDEFVSHLKHLKDL